VALVHRGQTEWGATGRRADRSDVPPITVGLQRADAPAEVLGGAEVIPVRSSPLSRARDAIAAMGPPP
jgi:broad specificity phosphatase PhoE